MDTPDLQNINVSFLPRKNKTDCGKKTAEQKVVDKINDMILDIPSNQPQQVCVLVSAFESYVAASVNFDNLEFIRLNRSVVEQKAQDARAEKTVDIPSMERVGKEPIRFDPAFLNQLDRKIKEAVVRTGVPEEQILRKLEERISVHPNYGDGDFLNKFDMLLEQIDQIQGNKNSARRDASGNGEPSRAQVADRGQQDNLEVEQKNARFAHVNKQTVNR